MRLIAFETLTVFIRDSRKANIIKVQLIGGLLLMAAIHGYLGGCGKANPAMSQLRAADELRQCCAGPLQRWVGREMKTLEAEMLETSGANGVRWIRPGEAITMDHRTDGINLEVDQKGLLVRVYDG